MQKALDGDRRLFAVAQRENVDDPAPDYLYTIGTVVRIIQTHRVRGGVQLLVQGEGRAQALSYDQEGQAMLHAVLLELETLKPRDVQAPAFQALDSELRDRAAELGTRRGVPAEALNQLIHGVDEPGPFADLVAFYLELDTPKKQELLELLDDEERMRACLLAVERELARIDAQEDIQAKVQSELGERQREMLLREQLKAIQKELGEEEERDDMEEMRHRIEELELSEEQRTEVDRELRRLERTSPQSAEYQVIRTYLEWITALPWNERAEEKIDPEPPEEIRDADHSGLCALGAPGRGLAVMGGVGLAYQAGTGTGRAASPMHAHSGAAVVGSLVALAVVYALSQRRGFVEPISLILVGVIISIMCGAGTQLVAALLPDGGSAATRLLGGSLNANETWGRLAATGGVVLAVAALGCWLPPAMAAAAALGGQFLDVRDL